MIAFFFSSLAHEEQRDVNCWQEESSRKNRNAIAETVQNSTSIVH